MVPQDSEKLDLSALEKASASLKDILAQPMNPYVRDGAIQRFEYTLELSWKFLQRQLKALGVVVGNPRDVFREARRSGLISDPSPWFEFLKSRHLTSQTYNEDVAREVFESAKRLDCISVCRTDVGHGLANVSPLLKSVRSADGESYSTQREVRF